MSELKAPWQWNNRRNKDWMKEYERLHEEYEQLRADGDLGEREWLVLTDADGKVVAEYAGCGSHELKISVENAAILEAAASLYEYVRDCADGGEVDATDIINGIEIRRLEFEE